jgi:deazaflavin-dependent oxidoreductase (nitroreductase family)
MKMPAEVRYFNKRYLNPLIGGIARSSWGPFCIIYHVGRRIGKPYETPLIAFPATFGFVIALTYGPEVDWYRNIKAVGHCQIEWHGKVYAIQKVEPLDRKVALPLLPWIFRTVLSLVGLKDFIKLEGQIPPQG